MVLRALTKKPLEGIYVLTKFIGGGVKMDKPDSTNEKGPAIKPRELRLTRGRDRTSL